MSRSSFAERFSESVGVPPMTYLTRWRMRVAADLFCTTSMSVAQVARRVGYQSESAFSRAFRAEIGMTPARFRRYQQRRRQVTR